MVDAQPVMLPFGGDGPPPRQGHDPELDRVESWWRRHKRTPNSIGIVIRPTFDQVPDAERTGRFDLEEVEPIERVYLTE